MKRLYRTVSILTILTALLLLSGCTSLAYYTQSVVGHSSLMLARQPIHKAIAHAEPELARKLELAIELRQFAISELGLPDNKSYQNYVPLKRDYPVWVVVAAEPFSLEPKQWCYLVIGCAAYRGYFSLASAERYAQSLQRKGYETYVGGVVAYSTLGWFSDPLLPSMLRNGVDDLAETLFHELAHQVLYVNGDSEFNEAFATVVGERGALRWLQKYRPNEVNNYRIKLNALNDFSMLIKEVKSKLSTLYASTASDAVKISQRERLFGDLRLKYELLKKQKWDNMPWFDHWFNVPINNARLAAFSTYRDRVPKLNAILDEYNEDFEQFYRHF